MTQNPASGLAPEPLRVRGITRVEPRVQTIAEPRHTPNAISTAIASVRKSPPGRPSAQITYTSATVANVNDSASPSPPLAAAGARPSPGPRATTGSTHRDSAVAAPATTANAISTTTSSSSPSDRHR
jgi:hypothetical protein